MASQANEMSSTTIKINDVEKQIQLIQGDCIDGLKQIRDKSIQLICIDPPYNIGKDTWDNIDNYTEWLISIIKILETKLQDNGSFFMFHNDMESISELMVSIKKNTKFVFKQMIVWNKRFEGSKKKGFLDGYVVKNDLHNWNKMAEYILFYTFDNSYKLKEARKNMNISQITISNEILSKTGGLTGWYSNLETGKNMPTRETIKPIEKHLKLKYEDIVPKFNNMKTDHSVWNYDMAKRCKIHITPKPVELLENIILHTTDEGDTVLDCFAGTGSIGYACINKKRKCILIEKEEKYCNYISKTLQEKERKSQNKNQSK
jgi:site-specific DNA-methyltransferase (adenine-specific)